MLVRPIGNPQARVMIIGDMPSVRDMDTGRVFSDSSGWELEKMLREAGITMGECFSTNVLSARVRLEQEIAFKKNAIREEMVLVNGDKYATPLIEESIRRLSKEIELVKPNLIICLGNLALWALTCKWNTAKWRGSMLQYGEARVICTYSPTEVFRQWELRPIVVQDFRRAHEYTYKEWPRKDFKFEISPTYTQVIMRLDFLLAELTAEERKPPRGMKIAYDIETLARNISCISLAWSKNEAICIPFMKMGKPEGYFTECEEAEIVFKLYQVMTHPNFQGITQNGNFDRNYICDNWNFIPRHYQDTMLSHHVLFPAMQKSLDFICSMHNEEYVYWKDDLKEWRTAIVHNETQYWNYNCEDSARTWEAAHSLQQCVDKMGLRAPHDFQQSLSTPVLKMMLQGVLIDLAEQRRMVIELRKESEKNLEWIEYVVGYPLNPRSPKQMKDFFYGEMKQPKQLKRTPTGMSPSCDSSSLAKVSMREPILKPLIDKIEEWRSMQVLISGSLADKQDRDGRMRCSYNIGGTVTFRFSSSENAWGKGQNLQNITSGSKE
jgi:uracil-DNA glycosylase family 4